MTSQDTTEEAAMSPADFKDARLRLKLTQVEFGLMLGYKGNRVQQMVMALESGLRNVREPQRRLIEAYVLGYRPPDWPMR